MALPGLRARLEILGTGPIDDLTIGFRGFGDQLDLELEANPDLYALSTVQAHLARLPCFLAAALDVPSISLSGPTLPGRVGAYGRGQVHLCATGPLAGGGDRDKPCFDGLDAARVAPELDRLLASLETR